MNENRFSFTDTKLKELPLPSQGKRKYYYDSKVPNLRASVKSTGTISLSVYRKVDGKPQNFTIGRIPKVSVIHARKEAIKINELLNQGINPKERVKESKQEATFSEQFNIYLEKYSKVNKKSWEKDAALFRNYLTPLKNKQLSKITKAIVRETHETIKANKGIYNANRSLSLVSIVFNKAIEWGWEGINPATGIKKFKEKSRDRFLQPSETSRFFKSLDDEPETIYRDFFYMLIFTGVRKTNLLQMRWEEIDIQGEVWRIPETKNGESQYIPLGADELNILKHRAKLKDKHKEWVFPSPKPNCDSHMYNPNKAWDRILERAEIKEFRMHDLRRTMGSYLTASGANNFTIGKALGHKSQEATAIYARLNIDPVRKAKDEARALMFHHAKLNKGDD